MEELLLSEKTALEFLRNTFGKEKITARLFNEKCRDVSLDLARKTLYRLYSKGQIDRKIERIGAAGKNIIKFYYLIKEDSWKI